MTVRSGKGDKDRFTVLPESLKNDLQQQLMAARKMFERDRQAGANGVSLPHALERKYHDAGKEWAWFWMFPAQSLSPLIQGPGDDDGITCTFPACSEASCGNPRSRHHPQRLGSFAASQFCHPSSGTGARHQNHTGIARPQQSPDHNDLYPRGRQKYFLGDKPARLVNCCMVAGFLMFTSTPS